MNLPMKLVQLICWLVYSYHNNIDLNHLIILFFAGYFNFKYKHIGVLLPLSVHRKIQVGYYIAIIFWKVFNNSKDLLQFI